MVASHMVPTLDMSQGVNMWEGEELQYSMCAKDFIQCK